MKAKKRIGFSVMDLILVVLLLAGILTGLFSDRIRRFLGREEVPEIEYTFLVENVTETARNHPLSGEEIFLSQNGKSIGTIVQVEEKKNLYESVVNPESQLEILTLTCKATTQAVREEVGYRVGEILIKPGSQLPVYTESASFVISVTMVKSLERGE